MENKNEKTVAVDAQSSKTELKTYVDFNRVNFNIPSTIPTYGDDVICKIADLLAPIVAMLNDTEGTARTKMNDTFSEAQVYDSFLTELEKYEEQLNRLIDVGYADKDQYVKTVLADLEKRIAETNDDNLKRKLNVKKSIVEIFENQLQSLRGHQTIVNTFKEQILLQQTTAYNHTIVH